MTGCTYNAKVMPLTTVTRVRPREGGGYDVTMKFTKARRATKRSTRTVPAEHVVFAAAAIGTQKLLHRLKAEGSLPRRSDRLGYLSRTNSESISGAIAGDRSVDYSYGIAITSSFHADDHTHVEPCRYGKGSTAISLMQTVLTDGDGPRPRWQTRLGEMWKQRGQVLDL